MPLHLTFSDLMLYLLQGEQQEPGSFSASRLGLKLKLIGMSLSDRVNDGFKLFQWQT